MFRFHRQYRSTRLIGAMAVLIVLLSACENPFQDEEEDKGTAPKVLDAGLFPPGDPDSDRLTTIAVGNTVELYVLIEDPDLDVDTTTMLRTFPDGSTDETEVTLDSQSAERMLYSFGGPVAVEEPTGGYQIKLTPKDANGNTGDTFRFSFTVTD